MPDIDLGPLQHAPHANLIRAIASKCAADDSIQAIWVGGSLAAGTGDQYSDIDFRIAVAPGQLNQWREPDWNKYLPLQPVGALLMPFGEQALLHHMVLTDGTIVDFFVQETTRQNPEPHITILAARTPEIKQTLASYERPAEILTRAIDAASARLFFVDYWITTHKQIKALYRSYDLSAFVGLYFERMALLRAYYMQTVGKDFDSRVTLHMLGALNSSLRGKLTPSQHNILGLPSRTPAETITAIDSIRTEMAQLGRSLAAQYNFDYPYELETVVQHAWNDYKQSLT